LRHAYRSSKFEPCFASRNDVKALKSGLGASAGATPRLWRFQRDERVRMTSQRTDLSAGEARFIGSHVEQPAGRKGKSRARTYLGRRTSAPDVTPKRSDLPSSFRRNGGTKFRKRVGLRIQARYNTVFSKTGGPTKAPRPSCCRREEERKTVVGALCRAKKP